MSGRFLWIVLGAMALGLVLLVVNEDAGSILGLRNDDFARAMYLSILGIVIAAGIVGSGMRFGAVTRSIAIWLAIILVLVAGYQYRYELQDIASRVTAGLIPGSPLSIIEEDGRAAVMVERMANGHFETRVEINGTPVNVIIDTGATGTVLTAEDAGRIGFAPQDLVFNIPVMTANGRANAARAPSSEIRIGDIARQDMALLVAESGRLERSLLGMNFISSLSGFDMRGERLILRD